ncbi:DUF7405 family protein [Patulibacter minatonensis]|uniref:DUF7405 family protein n=1 Tax=Patulibacter minatonensis TaxID=298163 RepID=UPI00056D427D|nr:hypothetical protein [Patulibacter minatonensis]
MRTTRRRLLLGGAASGAAAVGAVVAVATGDEGTTPGETDRARLPRTDRPARQHAWDAVVHRDAHGNGLPPKHHRLLLCDLAADPTPARAWAAEAALRRVERVVPDGPVGVFVVVGWGPSWFRRLGATSPIPRPKPLSDVEAPILDDPAAILHLASDDERRLDAVERALLNGVPLRGAGDTDLRGLLRVRTRRTGFVGAGLPRARQRGTVGLPTDRPIARKAPLYMGFQSGLRKNQATEDDVTIEDGPWKGGTTMHVSAIDLTLNTWYHGVDDAGRVRRMFAADRTPADVARHPTGLDNPEDVDLPAVAKEHGVIGHAQAMASVRRNGRPRIIRRDFDSADGDAAQVHFVALQRSIADFEATRTAMNAAKAVNEQAGVGAQINNGINEWITVTARGNYLVPARADRICPGLPGWSA